MSGQDQQFQKFVNELTAHLETGDFSTAVSFFNDTKYKEYLKNNSWDLIPIFCKHITKEAKLNNNALAACCEGLLEKLATEANSEEAVLEFLDQMDECDNEKFAIILQLLKISLSQNMKNKLKSLEWVLNSIRSYTEQYSYHDIVDEYDVQPKDIVFSDEKVLEIESVMNSVILFYNDFVQKVNDSSQIEEQRCLLSSRLIQFFDIFLPYIDIDLYPRLKVIRLKIINLLLQLISNPLSLLKHIFLRSINSMKSKKHTGKLKASKQIDLDKISDESSSVIDVIENLHPLEDETIVSNLACGMFYYSLLSESENEEIKIPLVYNPKYIMLSLIYVAVPFFDNKPNITVDIGLKFLNLLLSQLSDSLTKSDLYFSSHKNILVLLNNIMIFSEVEANRKFAVKCFKKYIESFNWEGRYLLFLNLRSHVSHPGSLSFLAGLLKESVSEFFELPVNSVFYYKFLKYYSGKSLFEIIKKYCFLTNVSKIDLVENADHIISSLNVLRYLVLRDKKNVIGVKFFIKSIYSDFLKPIKENIEASRNYYHLKLKECPENKSTLSSSGSDLDVKLSIKGENLPKLTNEEQKVAYYSCLNAVDLIDSLHVRLIECIQEIFPQYF